MKKLPLLASISILCLGFGISGVLHFRYQRIMADNAEIITRQQQRLKELERNDHKIEEKPEHPNNPVTINKVETELKTLRLEAEDLQHQIHKMEGRKQAGATHKYKDPKNHPIPEEGSGLFVEPSETLSTEYQENLFKQAIGDQDQPSWTGDARNLASAVRRFAKEQNGQFPESFEQASSYFWKSRELPRIEAFELVFTGTMEEISGIPHNAIALIRERDPWRTTDGKLARIYVMAGGQLEIVESEDNFKSWEAEHILPSVTLSN